MYGVDDLTYTQACALAIAPKVTAPLSMLGSALIILDVVRSPEKRGRTYSRLMVGMSALDLFFASPAAFMSTWPIPKGFPHPFASGTTGTCTAQGFGLQLSMGVPFYIASLSFYFFLVIAQKMSDDKMKKIEWIFHAVPLTFAFGMAIAGIPLTVYNPADLWCWIAALPAGCGNNVGVSSEPCVRGEYAYIYRWAFSFGPVSFCTLLAIINMSAVTYLVWAKERASRKFQFEHGQGSRSSSSFLSRICCWPWTKKNESMVAQVAWQAAFYIGTFFVVWVPPGVLRTMQKEGLRVHYGLVLAVAILNPLLGFFNFLVYIRPRVQQYQKANPEMIVYAAMNRAVRTTLAMCRCRNQNEDDAEGAEVLDPAGRLNHQVPSGLTAPTTTAALASAHCLENSAGNAQSFKGTQPEALENHQMSPETCPSDHQMSPEDEA